MYYRFALLLSVLTVSLGSPPRAAAEAVLWPHFELGVDLHGAVSLDGGRCRREQTDVVGCTGLAYGLLTVAPGLRFSPLLSVAAVPGIGLADRATVLQLTAEGRLHPLGLRSLDPSLGLDAGLIGLVDRLPQDEVGPATQLSHFAASFSAFVSFAWQLTDAVALQLHARVRYLGFPGDDVLARVSYRSTWLGSMGVGANLRL